MEDLNLIACLYPADGDLRAGAAIRMRENSGRYIPPQQETKLEYGSRESTVSQDDDEDHLASQPRLQLTFNPGPKAGLGFVIGTDENRCDVVLPKLSKNKIGRLHCVLTFDAERRLVLRDLSRNGTIVEYDGQGGEKRRTIVTQDDKGREKRHYFTWILSGGEASKVQKIGLQIEEIKFQIIVSEHETYPDLYNDNVDRFLHEATTNDELPFGALGIQSTTSTAQYSGAHTPTPQTPIYINQWRLGSGQFSIVNRVWDVSTGFVYASKEFSNMKESQWRKEASIMSQVLQLSNEHIVQFVALIETPSPQLILEYLPFGNLQDQHTQEPITDQESLAILCQSLDALSSVHEADIVHRDIKPENILVQSREPLRVKLSDFGLSKATTNLETFCGTHCYAAPEIYTRRGTYYTKACDIWSLGVVVFKYAYGPLPKLNDRDVGLYWCKKIIKRVNDWDSDPLLDFLSTAMLVIKPEKRLPTRKCWEQALQLSALSQSRCPTPTEASYSASDCLKEVSNPHWATPSATPTEVATFITMDALRNHNPRIQETSTASSQATVDHYLVGYDTEEQELDDQRSLVNPSYKIGGISGSKGTDNETKKRPN
ncbi:Maternal embryonic leucine zipper kinase [Lachnellula suecica]|uniref:Maternal embryonic leucine zipper kinase n=1 Tax=Lachnellula suecica TaxID=602035 RepID=A0A8T9BZN1_9HELO|nr:Maternal embryonic leucine zipper kinase [Lachnellula suecica]